MEPVNYNPVFQPKAQEAKPSLTLQSLFERISLLAKKIFYFLVPCARPTFEVVLVDHTSEMDAMRAEKFLNQQLPYRHKIHFEKIENITEDDFESKRFIHMFHHMGSTEMFYSPFVNTRLKPEMKFLIVFDKDTPSLVGNNWDKHDQAHHLFRNDRLAAENAPALKKFFA